MLRSPLASATTVLISLSLLAACTPFQGLQNVASTGGSLANSMAGIREQTALTPGELRQLQTREFRTTKAAAFASVMTVLLDTGYRVLSADLESGLITATAPTTARLKLDPTGLARSNETPLTSVYVEERDAETSRVRIVFSLGTTSTGQLAGSGERAIYDPDIYRLFYSRLEEEVNQRPVSRQPVSRQIEQQSAQSPPNVDRGSPSESGALEPLILPMETEPAPEVSLSSDG